MQKGEGLWAGSFPPKGLRREITVLALSVIADAMPPLSKGEALAVHAKFLVSPEALPLGELSSVRETERART